MRKKKSKTENPLSAFTSHRKADTPTIQENHVAGVVGGKRHAGSGSSVWMKSDVSNDQYQIECKQTCKESMSLKLEWLEKISNEASGKSKTPLMHIRFTKAEVGVDKDWVMMSEREFKRLIGDNNE